MTDEDYGQVCALREFSGFNEELVFECVARFLE